MGEVCCSSAVSTLYQYMRGPNQPPVYRTLLTDGIGSSISVEDCWEGGQKHSNLVKHSSSWLYFWLIISSFYCDVLKKKVLVGKPSYLVPWESHQFFEQILFSCACGRSRWVTAWYPDVCEIYLFGLWTSGCSLQQPLDHCNLGQCLYHPLKNRCWVNSALFTDLNLSIVPADARIKHLQKGEGAEKWFFSHKFVVTFLLLKNCLNLEILPLSSARWKPRYAPQNGV